METIGKRFAVGFGALVMAVHLAACGGTAPAQGQNGLPGQNGVTVNALLSCSFTVNGGGDVCIEVSRPGQALGADEVAKLQAGCTQGSAGAFSHAACPAANRVGTCALANVTEQGVPGVAEKVEFYPAFSAADAQQMCAGGGGTFTNG